uniref:Nucleotide-diphospho-sugar transferase domain-containing protein n=1 Tax=Plectus sambesii TaxID=2011161 RepID=A0A914WQX8_9BILA
MGLSRPQWWSIPSCLLGMLAVLVVRKAYIAEDVMYQVRAYRDQVSQETIVASAAFKQLVVELRKRNKPPALFFLNQHALNMTYNFLCNTAEYENVHDRFIFITLDSTARDSLRKAWPNIAQFYWPTPCLTKPFNFADALYQTIYILRANLAVLLAERGFSFWMMQQDTFWHNDLFAHNLEQLDDSSDMLFDQLGDENQNNLRTGWINGANFFVKASQRTVDFINATANLLQSQYVPDVGVMTMLCHTWGGERINCSYIPHRIANCWEWMFTDQSWPPTIMQMDAETDAGGKLNELAKIGFYFLNDDRKTCNSSAVSLARHRMSTGQVKVNSKTCRSLER